MKAEAGEMYARIMLHGLRATICFRLILAVMALAMSFGAEGRAFAASIGVMDNIVNVDFGEVSPLGSPFVVSNGVEISILCDVPDWSLTIQAEGDFVTADRGDTIDTMSASCLEWTLHSDVEPRAWVRMETSPTTILSDQEPTSPDGKVIRLDFRLHVGWGAKPTRAGTPYKTVLKYTVSAGKISSSYAVPDPFTPTGGNAVTIGYWLEGEEGRQIAATFYNTEGLLVQTMGESRVSGGWQTLLWDGKDLTGNIVPEGQYTYVIRTGSGALVASGIVTIDAPSPPASTSPFQAARGKNPAYDDATGYQAGPYNTALSVRCEMGSSMGSAGDIISVSVVVTNSGTVDLPAPMVEVILPPGLRYVPGTARLEDMPAREPDGRNPYTWFLPSLRAGYTTTLYLKVVIPANIQEGRTRLLALAYVYTGNRKVCADPSICYFTIRKGPFDLQPGTIANQSDPQNMEWCRLKVGSATLTIGKDIPIDIPTLSRSSTISSLRLLGIEASIEENEGTSMAFAGWSRSSIAGVHFTRRISEGLRLGTTGLIWGQGVDSGTLFGAEAGLSLGGNTTLYAEVAKSSTEKGWGLMWKAGISYVVPEALELHLCYRETGDPFETPFPAGTRPGSWDAALSTVLRLSRELAITAGYQLEGNKQETGEGAGPPVAGTTSIKVDFQGEKALAVRLSYRSRTEWWEPGKARQGNHMAEEKASVAADLTLNPGVTLRVTQGWDISRGSTLYPSGSIVSLEYRAKDIRYLRGEYCAPVSGTAETIRLSAEAKGEMARGLSVLAKASCSLADDGVRLRPNQIDISLHLKLIPRDPGKFTLTAEGTYRKEVYRKVDVGNPGHTWPENHDRGRDTMELTIAGVYRPVDRALASGKWVLKVFREGRGLQAITSMVCGKIEYKGSERITLAAQLTGFIQLLSSGAPTGTLMEAPEINLAGQLEASYLLSPGMKLIFGYRWRQTQAEKLPGHTKTWNDEGETDGLYLRVRLFPTC